MGFQVQIVSPKQLGDLMERMAKYPDKLNRGMNEAMQATLLTMTENIPPYPAQPEGSDYRRTGTLGRTLGSGVSGGASGQAEIFEVKPIGNGYEGRFGTNLSYAPYVIGDNEQARHMSHWWTLSKVAERAKDKIDRIWQSLAEVMARFVDGKQ